MIAVIIMLLGKARIKINLKYSMKATKENALIFLNNTPTSNESAPNVVIIKLKHRHIIILCIQLIFKINLILDNINQIGITISIYAAKSIIKSILYIAA